MRRFARWRRTSVPVLCTRRLRRPPLLPRVGGVRPRHSEEGGAWIDRDPAKMTILSEVQALDQTVGGLVIGDPNIIGFGTSF